MKIFASKDIKRLFLSIIVIAAVTCLISQMVMQIRYEEVAVSCLVLSVFAAVGVLLICFQYFTKQNRIMEDAVSRINAFLEGDSNARIECDEEGELNRLFHSVNTLATVLNAQTQNELRAKEFLKGTISDISHQLKTPLSALSIYNSLLMDEAGESPEIKEFASLSEQELDRIETLVQNLLKITKLDAGSIVIEKAHENIADMMHDIELHFSYRAKQEQKTITLEGDDQTPLYCDRNWMIEAISNIVKNAFDHTRAGNHIQIEWKQRANLAQIIIKDDGTGIHPEDIHHIFKRFYRSRFSQDTQGIGLGLPLTKAIIEAHDGSIAVDSAWGAGSTFTLSFLIPTKL